MSTFKVGDRVRDASNKSLGAGVIVALNYNGMDHHLVHFDSQEDYCFEDGDPASDGHLRRPEELELVERQPNRTYFEQDAVDPGHYKFPGGVEVIDITRHMDFLTGNAVKYLARAGRKGDRLTDLQKARKYIDWAIEDEESK